MINQSTLDKLSKQLSSHQIVWGVGGSYLLQVYDLYSNPKDLDIWVQPCDMPKVKQIFKDFEEIETDIPLPEEFHYKMKYFGVDVDFIACFIVKPNQNRFQFSILPENIKAITLKNGSMIPCTFLEDWYIVYKLLKREEKASIIERVFRERKIELSDKVLRTSLKNSENYIPKKVVDDTYNLINYSLQLSFFDYYQQEEVDNPDAKSDSITTNIEHQL